MIRLTRHAEEAVAARSTAIVRVEHAVTSPDRMEPDPRDPSRTRSYKAAADGQRPELYDRFFLRPLPRAAE